MQNLDNIFKNKKITQMGLGLLGRGVGDAAFLASHGADLIVTDIKTEDELTDSLQALKKYPNITYRLGGHDKKDFVDRNFILKGAGVPLDSSYIKEARKNNIPVDMSASLFARIASIPMIGVTGTRGKSTVTHLLNAILKADGRNVILGGNVLGVSNLALLDDLTEDSIGIFELDSWQCQGFGEEKTLDVPGIKQGPRSPELAIFTTFMPDHQNYYDGDLDAYLKDKVNIFLHQTESDTFVIGRQALPALAPYKKNIQAHVILAHEGDVPKGWNVRLLGTHNRYNIGLATAAARAFGVDDDVIRGAVQALEPLPGRLEFMRKIRGVEIYNDTNATTPEATAAALEALDPEGKKHIVLIAGGADKGLDPKPLVDAAKAHTKACVLLAGTGTEVLKKEGGATPMVEATSLHEATEAACDLAKEGDIVLFSPGYASFGMFKNEYDRGDQFTKMVRDAL